MAIFALAAVGLCYWRLFYGVDFTDEAWYVAVPYRFLLGGKPYVDELSVPQTSSAVILYPFLWVYHAIEGRTGIVLFVRHVHFLIAAAAACAVTAALRRSVGAATAIIIGTATFAFVPFDIPSVSYDSLGSELLTAGLFLAFFAYEAPRVRVWAGLCLGVAAFAYPPLAIAVVACCFVRLVRQDGGRRGEVLGFTLPALVIPIVGFAALAAVAGPDRIVSDYRRSSHYLQQAGGFRKLHGIAAELKDTLPHWYLPLIAIVLLAVAWSRWKWLAALIVSVLPLTMLPERLLSYTGSLEFVSHAGWLAVVLLPGLWHRREARVMFATVWLPALVGGLVTAYSSSNGGTNFGVGFFPALIVTLVFSVWAIQDLVGSGSPFAACPALLTAVVLLVLGVVPVYRDVPLSQANVTLSSGPFAGLRTNRPKQAFLARLQRDLARVDARCRILFFNDFPAGYLLTAAQPDTNAVWTATVPGPLVFAYHRDLLGYFRRHGLPDVAVMMLRIPFGLPASARRDTYPDRDPLVARLRTPPFHVVARRLDYVVYARDRC